MRKWDAASVPTCRLEAAFSELSQTWCCFNGGFVNRRTFPGSSGHVFKRVDSDLHGFYGDRKPYIIDLHPPGLQSEAATEAPMTSFTVFCVDVQQLYTKYPPAHATSWERTVMTLARGGEGEGRP